MTSGTTTTTITVNNADELWAALKAAQGGETIQLAAGDYGKLYIDSTKHDFAAFASEVTLRAADPEAPASFSRLDLRGVENLTFDGLVLDYDAAPGEVFWVRAGNVDGGANLTFRNMVFDGDLAEGVDDIQDGHGTGYGLVVTDVQGYTLENNTFFHFHRAAVTSGSEDVVVRGNEIYGIRSDGLNFVNVDRVLIEENYIHDFDAAEGSGDHGDMIQFWTRNSSSPSTDIVIRNNVLDSGAGDETQSIFMRNEVVDKGQAGYEMFYKNVTIEGNLIRNAHHHGISVGETDGLTIANNTVLHNAATHDGSGIWTPKVNIASDSLNVAVSKNIAHAINGSGDGWLFDGNLIVQRDDPTGDNYYGDLFVNALADLPGDFESLQAMPDSVVMAEGIGSPLTQFEFAPDALTATARTAEIEDVRFGMAFDGTLTRDTGGFVDYTEALFTWDFGDGTTNTGMQQVHAYREPGTYTVTLTVEHVDGSVDSNTLDVVVPDPVLLDLDVTAEGLTDSSVYDSDVNSSRAASMVVEDPERGFAVQLQTDRGFKLERENVLQVFGQDAFTVDLSLKADGGSGSAGELFRIYSSMRARIDESGDLIFGIAADGGGYFEIETRGANLLDGQWHDLSIAFDGVGGIARAYVDGAAIAEVAVSGRSQQVESWDFNFGSSYSKEGFSGLIADIAFHGEAIDPSAPFVYEPIALEPDPIPAAFLEPVEDSEPVVAPVVAEPTATMPETAYTLAFEEPLADSVQLKNGTSVATNEAGDSWIALDGVDDFVNVKGLDGLAESSQISFMLDFASADSDADRLLWSHMRYGVELHGEELSLFVATAGGGFEEISAGRVARDDGQWHRVGVSIDDEADTLRVYVDGELTAERTDMDLDISGGTWRGLTLGGTFWGHRYGGEIDNFAIVDEVLSDSILASRSEDQLIG